MTTLEEKLASARAALRERAWVTRRTAEVTAERAALAARHQAALELWKLEQADVERLSGFFRSVLAGSAELSREQREAAAAKLTCDELADELRALDADLAQLAARAALVASAEADYEAALAEQEARLARGAATPPGLAEVAARRSQLTAALRELDEAIASGKAAVDALAAAQSVAASGVWWSTGGSPLLGRNLLDLVLDVTQSVQMVRLRTLVATAQQALLRFQADARAVGQQHDDGLLQVAPMRGVASLIAQDLVLGNLLTDVAQMSSCLGLTKSYVDDARDDLLGRRAALERALVDLGNQRARLLDPPALRT